MTTVLFDVRFSYTLFPLLLLLDAAVACRSQGKNQPEEFPKTPYRVSDKVAEGVINCLEELLKKCHIGSIDQVKWFRIPTYPYYDSILS